MFPNARLMVVAILAAIAGIGCGLGLFATFRVNHEPLARLAERGPPLQLAFDHPALGSDAQAPLEARLLASGAAKVFSTPAVVALPSPAAERAEADAAPAGDPSAQQAGADAASAADSSAQQAGAEAAPAADSGVEQADIGAGAPDRSEQSNTASRAAASLAAAVAPEQSSVTLEAAAAAPSPQEAITPAQHQQPAAAAATAPAGKQTAAVNPANDRKPAPEPAKATKLTKPTKPPKPTKTSERKAAKPKAKAERPAAPARRATKTVRARRPAATVAQPAYQYSQPTYSQPAYPQPTYTWTNGSGQLSLPVNQTKRRRSAKDALSAAQSSPSAATAGWSGSQ